MRFLFAAGGIMMIDPNLMTDLVGLVILLICVAVQRINMKKKAQKGTS